MKTQIFYILIGISCIVTSFFAYRSVIFSQFDHKYISDLYDHSQWTIPRSIRSIGDDTLYQLAGYALVTKNSFFEINPEVPPFGKYLYGHAINAWQKPYFMSVLLFVMLTASYILGPNCNFL